ncbi:hypothetical protein EJQ19_21095 [Paenibacillus whitsoniae]|uniref:Uncharacterized protein n=1 Tax=Paenibacillus whitsoniae TaxID=2496558 RepID=A0A3S0A1W3_9BACL|nr:hypothetical protein EJQ19_21095 [Paenibacillus whitsoniae]
MRTLRNGMVIILLICLIAGCTSRGIPTIQQDMFERKISVLMLSSAELPDAAKQSIGQALLKWRDQSSIAFDWVKDLQTVDADAVAKLKTASYDYIYVAGNGLFSSAAAWMGANPTSGKWTFLQSEPDAANQSAAIADKAALLQVDTAQIETMKKTWVQSLLDQQTPIEWVTKAERPIPSVWAPSEESDHIVLLDNNPQWFQQLAFQVNQHHAKWVVFYAQAEEAQVQKAKTLGISVMDLTAALSANLSWDDILANRLGVMMNHSWQAGVQNYNLQELKELKMK